MEAPTFAELYSSLIDYQGEHSFQDVLLPWMSYARQNMAMMENYGYLDAMQKRGDEIQRDLWRWYALSRVNDYLLLAFQAPTHQIGIQLPEYIQFFGDLGMRPFDHKKFHPFFHEIVEVEQAEDPLEPITLVEMLWPGLMLRNLLFSRAGVKVRGGRQVINKKIAEKSTLYFTFRRHNRPVSDLSHGWGGNSQWRTCFRRDYEDASAFYYNVDGGHDLTLVEQIVPEREHVLTASLYRAERIELLVNRCFICTDKQHYDLWPFDDTYVERKGSE